MKNLTILGGFAGLVLLGGVAQATTIPSTISSTLTITTDSQLTGNVRCTVTNNPCIKFGAPNIKLELKGFTMTGNNPNRTSCTSNPAEIGIDTNGKNYVVIRGPGLVKRFNGAGIAVRSDHSIVDGVALTSICGPGIFVPGSYNYIEDNSISRAALNGQDAGISLHGNACHNHVQHNEVVGAGPFPITASQSGNGISVGVTGFPSTFNWIEDNDISGNAGAGLAIVRGSTGNTVQNNQVLGNAFTLDIIDANAAGANTYDSNLCEVSRVGIQSICKLVDITGHSNFEPDGQ